jgi:signal transduction histidine kinase
MNQTQTDLLDSLREIVCYILDGQKVPLGKLDLQDTDHESLDLLRKELLSLARQYNDSHEFIQNLSKGKLDEDAPARNNFATPYKQLQSELRHLTWQINQISEGDLEQKVSFSGDFSQSMNRMIRTLRQNQKLSRQNERMLQELNDLNATKDRLFSIIAHDLKHPFNGILGFTELLLEALQRNQTTHLEEYATHVKKSAVQGYQLLIHLLDWAKLQTGRFKPVWETLNLKGLIEHIVDTEQSEADKKQIELSYSCPESLMVFADKMILEITFRNLIGNAIKYTQPGGCVRVVVQHMKRYVAVSVSDTGVGMSTELIQKLMLQNTIVSSKGTSNETGTGLGLMLCQSFLNKIGSKLHIISTLNVGTTVQFNLKIAQ